MARRSAPPGSGPAYMAPTYGGGAPRGRLPDPNESVLGRFWREQIIAPQYLPGNLSIVTAVALFAGRLVPPHFPPTSSPPSALGACVRSFRVEGGPASATP